MIVMKFGGTSVEDAAAIDRSCGIVGARAARKPFVVVSALGGATNGLLEAGSFAARGEIGKAMTIADRLEYRHIELLPSTAEYFVRLRELLKALEAIGEKGLLAARQSEPENPLRGRPKRLYRMEAAGLRALQESLESAKRLSELFEENSGSAQRWITNAAPKGPQSS